MRPSREAATFVSPVRECWVESHERQPSPVRDGTPAITPRPPPARASSTKSASAPVRGPRNQTIPAECALRRPILRHQSRSPPAPATVECSHRSMPAAPAPHSPTAHPPPAPLAKFALPPPALPPDGCQSPPPRNSPPWAVGAATTASPPPDIRLT